MNRTEGFGNNQLTSNRHMFRVFSNGLASRPQSLGGSPGCVIGLQLAVLTGRSARVGPQAGEIIELEVNNPSFVTTIAILPLNLIPY